MRLPSPCPLPVNITDDVEAALTDDSKLLGIKKMRFLRQASLFYWGICQRPTHDEYVVMAITLCDNYPKLKDKKPQQGEYWVMIICSLSVYIIFLLFFFLHLQFSVKEYLTQRYRSLRRNSEPSVSNNLPKKPKFAPELEPAEATGAVKRGDEVGYSRNMERLCVELKKKQPNHSLVKQLINLTYIRRREIVQSSNCTTTNLMDEFPF